MGSSVRGASDLAVHAGRRGFASPALSLTHGCTRLSPLLVVQFDPTPDFVERVLGGASSGAEQAARLGKGPAAAVLSGEVDGVQLS